VSPEENNPYNQINIKKGLFCPPPIIDEEFEPTTDMDEEFCKPDHCSVDYFVQKGILPKLIKFLDTKYPDLRSNFEYLNQRRQYFLKVEKNDASIKHFNIDKNIPFDLGDIDSIFYDLDKLVSAPLLQKIYDDYRKLNALLPEKIEEITTNKIDLEEDPNELANQHEFDDFDDLPPELPTLSLSKTVSSIH